MTKKKPKMQMGRTPRDDPKEYPELVEVPSSEWPKSIQQMKWQGLIEHDLRVFTWGEANVKVGSTAGWHLSISFKDRYPTWDELAWLRYNSGLIPKGVTMALMLPPEEQYINIGFGNTFHLWQVALERDRPKGIKSDYYGRLGKGIVSKK